MELYEAFRDDNPDLYSLSKVHLTAAVNTAPENPMFHVHLGYWYYLKHQCDKAFESFRLAGDIDPRNPYFAANTGLCAYLSGHFRESAFFLEKALAMDGEHADWLNVMGLSLMSSGNPGRALEAFRSACLADPENEVFPANLAMVHETLHAPSDILQ
jgi:lipoprotein NlpI